MIKVGIAGGARYTECGLQTLHEKRCAGEPLVDMTPVLP